MRILNEVLPLPSTDMSASIVSNGQSIEHLPFVTVYLVWSGAPTGSLVIQLGPTVNGPWFDADTTALAGAVGTKRVPFLEIGDAFMRVKYVFTSGTGTLAVNVTGKGF